MKIETYSDKYKQDVIDIVNSFHKEVIQFYDPDFDPAVVAETIAKFKETNAGNAFLLIVDDKCEGIMAGFELQSMINQKRTFQELVWYVNKPHRMLGVFLLKQAEEMLTADGFDVMIMAVLESPRTSKIRELYKCMGFMLFETHYLKALK